MRWKWALRRIFVIFLTIFLVFESFQVVFQGENAETEYPDDFDLVKDEIYVRNYLKLMQMGQANPRPVVEPTQTVEEHFLCFLSAPNVVKSGNWLKMAGIHVFSAYFDDRENSLYPENTAVQLLAMSNHTIEGKINIFCNIFEKSSGKYAIVKGYIREIWQRGWDPRDSYQMPNLITCPIPKRLDYGPDTILITSISRKKCQNVREGMEVVMKPKDEHLLKNSNSNRKKVAVCVKGLDYQEDISYRLLEWIEMQFFFGADSVSIYHFYLTDNTRKVLDWYKNTKNLEVIPLTLPPGNPNDPVNRTAYLKSDRPAKRRHELLPYNDCFYRHIHTHHYVLILDIDEVIVPIDTDNYSDLLENYEKLHEKGRMKKMRISSISGRNVFKFRSNFTLSSMKNYMISNRKRSRKTSPNGEYGKSFSSTSTVATVFNHFALHKLSPSVGKSQFFPESMALKLHYKSECPWEFQKNECHQLEYDLINDTSLERFETTIRRRVDDAAGKIGL